MSFGWCASFNILLAGDKAGRKAKDRYIKDFGALEESRIFTIGDVLNGGENSTIEDVLSDKDVQMLLESNCAPVDRRTNKLLINRMIEEVCAKKSSICLEASTVKSFQAILGSIGTPSISSEAKRAAGKEPNE